MVAMSEKTFNSNLAAVKKGNDEIGKGSSSSIFSGKSIDEDYHLKNHLPKDIPVLKTTYNQGQAAPGLNSDRLVSLVPQRTVDKKIALRMADPTRNPCSKVQGMVNGVQTLATNLGTLPAE